MPRGLELKRAFTGQIPFAALNQQQWRHTHRLKQW